MSASPLENNESINLGELLFSLKRRWRWIAIGGGIGLAGSAFINLTTPSVWEGEFQIVVNQGQSSTSSAGALLGQASALVGLGGVAGGGNQLESELQILQSPSVLEPVYQRFAHASESSGFRSWRSQLSVEAAKGTNVITVRYRDRDPKRVLPITQAISKAYQAYSGRQRRREIDSALAYVESQISSLRPRSEASRREVEAFIQRYQLTAADGMPASQSILSTSPTPSLLGNNSTPSLISGLSNLASGGSSTGSSLRDRRSTLLQEQNQLRLKLRQVVAAGDRYVAFRSGAEANTSIGNVLSPGSSRSLGQVETELAERRSRFTAKDPSITRLELERRILISEINRQTTQNFKQQLQLISAELTSLKRPSGVIETFQTLYQQASRRESTLVSLENSLAQLKLEQARQTLPWDLISTPTVLPAPVEPRRGRLLGFGLLAGLIAGGAAGVAADRSSGRIYDRDELVNLLELPLLGTLPGTAPELLASGPLAGSEGFSLIPLGDIPEVQIGGLARQLEAAGCGPVARTLELFKALQGGRACLVAAPGSATRVQLSQLRDDLRFAQAQPQGVLWLRD